MKTGIVTYAYYRFDTAEGARRIKDHGYDGIDYQGFIDTETELFAVSEAEFERTVRADAAIYRGEGLEIFQAHGPWRYPPRDAEEADRAERFEKMAKAVRGCAYLGCENMVIHPLMPYGSHSDAEPERVWSTNLEFMSRLAEVGKEYGVTVCFENMPFRENPVSKTEHILRMVREVNSDFFKICLDTGHSAVHGESPADAVRMIGKDLLRTLHVHDNNGERDYHWLPGTGVIDFADFASALHEIGFEGAVSLETGISRTEARDAEDHDQRERELAAFARRIAENKMN